MKDTCSTIRLEELERGQGGRTSDYMQKEERDLFKNPLASGCGSREAKGQIWWL